ncbi:MAG: DUF262 domain-containing protein [Desulfovibrionaceae bacterium]|nr:DUF262 domain-containing protein [Desulfovibrionaceae bacterium]MBF0514964.1 DUF262 domain-containing protein [Desulfovibrionaceae bacterium]
MNMTPPGGKTIDPGDDGRGPRAQGFAALPAHCDPRGGDGLATLGPRALFETTSMRLDDLLHHIAQNLLALPAFARPFLWGGREAAWLLDSLFKGYPAGVCIVWEYRPPAMYRAIGRDYCRRPPALLLADGRQRLTALYCALRGALPAAEGQGASRIQVAFNPINAAFAPAGTKTRDNPEYIPDIAGLWKTPSSSRKIAEAYLSRLGRAIRLDEDGLERVCLHIDRLLDMLHYCFPILELPAQLSENEVKAIFARVNHGARPGPAHGPSANPADAADSHGSAAAHSRRVAAGLAGPAGPVASAGSAGSARALWRRLSDGPRLIVKNSVPAGRAWSGPQPAALAGAGPVPAEATQANDPPLQDQEPIGEMPIFPARSFVAL